MATMASQERSHREMRQRAQLRDSIFGLKALGHQSRPVSVAATEIMDLDSDWDEEDDVILSEVEEGQNSPRASVNSSGSGQRSITTLSSYDEVHTPRLSQEQHAFPEVMSMRPVEGPRGPHLFRSSGGSSISDEFQHALSLSPITPKAPSMPPQELDFCISFDQLRSLPAFDAPDYRFTDVPLDPSRLQSWSPAQVAQWMLDAGVELSVADKFVENDINGGIVVTLKFEDLRELDIPSFGLRSRLWDLIHVLRGSQPSPPEDSTDIEDHPSREVRKEAKKDKHGDDDCSKARRQRSKSKRDRRQGSHEDLISPMESVSIVGIEQLMPKPHSCHKGENCSKYRKYQRLKAEFMKDHPFADADAGAILIAGNPGNPQTADALLHSSPTKLAAPALSEEPRPISDVVPSVVASSDVLGPGDNKTPWQYLQEAALRHVEKRDPQDNVKQFIEIQHSHILASNDVPDTPPFEMYPTPPPSNRAQSRASLPRLSIPSSHSSNSNRPTKPHPLAQQPFVPYLMDKAEALSPELQSPPGNPFVVSKTPYRFGTPFSDMDVPVTAVPIGPIARETSQSVPPDMNYRSPVHAIPVRTASRMGRHKSVSVLPPVKENVSSPGVVSPIIATQERRPSLPTDVQSQRPNWPLRDSSAAAPSASASAASAMLAPTRQSVDDSDITFQGPMRKRRTRMLRHEWHEGYFTLKGTRLAMHRDAAQAQNRQTLEYVDIDDYAIACSGAASTGRLNAAFKAVNVALGKDPRGSGGKYGLDPGAFSFQLVPQDKRAEGLGRLRKRESAVPAALSSGGPDAGVNTTGKAHHFAVKGRDERIEWMRELMLAKALRQKGGEGFAINVNGNMI